MQKSKRQELLDLACDFRQAKSVTFTVKWKRSVEISDLTDSAKAMIAAVLETEANRTDPDEMIEV